MGVKRRSFPKKKRVNKEQRVKEMRLMTVSKGYKEGCRGNRNVDETERENKGCGRETIKQLDSAAAQYITTAKCDLCVYKSKVP